MGRAHARARWYTDGVDDAFERRAAERRATWQGGVAHSWDELEEKGLDFWRSSTPAARLSATWGAIVQAWVIKGKHGPPPGLQGSIVGVGRFER
jgi:hypothetical protein